MNKPSIPEVKSGDRIVLLLADMDPPSNDLRRAADAILARPDVDGLWLCPIPGKDPVRIRTLATIFGTEYACSVGRPVTTCTIALDKDLSIQDFISWVRPKYPDFKFSVAVMPNISVSDREPIMQVRFSAQPHPPTGFIPISLDKFVSVQENIKQRIASGADESSNMFIGVWNYIQKNKVYR